MNFIHYRFTHQCDEDILRFTDFVMRNADKILIVFEDADEEVNRPHLHSILHTKYTLSNFRKKFKEKFPNYGRGDFGSCVIESLEKMERYCSKGKKHGFSLEMKNPNIVYCNGYSYSDIEIRHNEYWEENNRLKTETNKGIPKQSVKKKTITWMQEINDILVEENPNEKTGHWAVNLKTKHIVYDMVMKKLGNSVKKISPKIIRELVDGQMNTLCGLGMRRDYWCSVFPEEDRFDSNPYT